MHILLYGFLFIFCVRACLKHALVLLCYYLPFIALKKAFVACIVNTVFKNTPAFLLRDARKYSHKIPYFYLLIGYSHSKEVYGMFSDIFFDFNVAFRNKKRIRLPYFYFLMFIFKYLAHIWD